MLLMVQVSTDKDKQHKAGDAVQPCKGAILCRFSERKLYYYQWELLLDLQDHRCR
jgi:hypothetical protein